MTDFKRVSCNLCGSDRASLVYKVRDFLYNTTDEEFDLVKCDECSLVYLNPRPVDMGRYYPKNYGPHAMSGVHIKKSLKRTLDYYYNLPSDNKRNVGFFEKIALAVHAMEVRWKNTYFFLRIPYAEGKRILDIGCGGGQYLLALKKLGWPASSLHGIDYPNENLLKARDLEKLNITEGGFMDTALPESFYDVITLRHVLEHLDDPGAALRKIHSMLKPGGEVMINVPNYKSLERVMFGSECLLLDPPRHLYDFTPRTLALFLDRAGFEVAEMLDKKSPSAAVWSIERRYSKISKFTEKYVISNMLTICALFGYSGEILCRAVKKQ